MNETQEAPKRVFKYNGQTYADPNTADATYTVEEIKQQLASVFPEIAQASVEKKTLADGTEEITFVKKAGTKG
jgi:PRTRC genetic system protein C